MKSIKVGSGRVPQNQMATAANASATTVQMTTKGLLISFTGQFETLLQSRQSFPRRIGLRETRLLSQDDGLFQFTPRALPVATGGQRQP